MVLRCLILLLSVLGVCSKGATRLNVLLICVDDLKPLLGCYGEKTVKTPQIDKLARQGVLFTKAYCNQAVCAPSRNALLTGIRPTSVGIYDLGTNFRIATPDAVTLPQYFKEHGYRTEGLGKIFHVGHGNHEDPKSWSVPHMQMNSIAYALPENRAATGLTREEAYFSNQEPAGLPRGGAYEAADVADDGYPDGRIADEAIARLRNARTNENEPFFLAVGFLKPHLPFCAPKKYWDLYKRDSFKVPQNQNAPDGAPNYAPTTWGELRQYKGTPNSGPLTEDQARTLIHGYYAAISYIDTQVGKVLDELDRLKMRDNTIVVLWGDHGFHLGDHGMWCKHSNYEQANRIPLLVSAPKLPKGKTTATLAESVDIYPTLIELAGLPQPSSKHPLEGESLVQVLKRPTAKGKEAVFHVYPRSRPGDGQILGRAARTERYRLVEWKKPGASPDTAEFELYDYISDPLETTNLASTQPAVVKKLHALITAQPEAKPQIGRPAVDRAALFQRKDTNNDGSLTREEFLKDQPDPAFAPARFLRFDANNDNLLSREEFIHQGNLPK